jgi:hypothetical protein
MTHTERIETTMTPAQVVAAGQLTAHVELMDSHGRTLVTVVAVNSAADIFPAAEDWADKHGFSDYAGNEWWAA